MTFKQIALMILIFSFVISCNNSNREEIIKLKDELEECQKDLQKLENSPHSLLQTANQYFAVNKYSNAKEVLNKILQNYSGTPESVKALELMEKIEQFEKQKNKKAEEKRSLGFKTLIENNNIEFDKMVVKFNSITPQSKWIFDNYGNGYKYLESKRGERFITAQVTISSEDIKPLLPPIAVYKLVNNNLALIGTADYEFSKWENYSTYLGNHHDTKNDFEYTKSISFSIGYAMNSDVLSNEIIFLVIKKEGCFTRVSKRLNNPPVYYSSVDCNLKMFLTLDDFEKDYELIKIFNKSKM